MVCFYASKIYPILLDFVLYGNTCSEEHLYLKKLALSPGDPKQPLPGEGVPGQLELPRVCLRRHSGS